MEITVNIKSPGLETAINNLANTLTGVEAIPNQGQTQKPETPAQEAQQQQPAPVQEQPVQPQQQQQAPVQQQPAQQTQPQQGVVPANIAVPTSNPEYSFDQLAVAATQLMDIGKQQDLMAILGEFNIQALTELPKEQFGAFATKLREKGAKI